jgi:hypothetical protein
MEAANSIQKGKLMRFCLFMMPCLFVCAPVSGVQDCLVSIYQPLADPQGKLVIREIPFISGYAEPETRISALGQRNRLLQIGPRDVPDSNLVSLFKIKVSAKHQTGWAYNVEFDLTQMQASKVHRVTEEEVVEAAILCLRRMFGPKSPYKLTLKIRCQKAQETLWKKYEGPIAAAPRDGQS